MFTFKDYVGIYGDSPDWNDERRANARRLIDACTKLQLELEALGVHFVINPKTGTTISGETFGGFRPQSCPIGAADSAHKAGMAVDRYDPHGDIDSALLEDFGKNGNNSLLVKCGIYIEAPSSTIGWSHWSIRAPGSGHHIFFP